MQNSTLFANDSDTTQADANNSSTSVTRPIDTTAADQPTGEHEWQCGICSKSFATKALVAQHIRSSHLFTSGPLVGVVATTHVGMRHDLFDKEQPEKHHHQKLIVPASQAPMQFFRDSSENVKVNVRPPHGQKRLHAQIRVVDSGHSKLPVIERTPKSAASDKSTALMKCVGRHGCTLKTGDVLRLGRFSATVEQVCLTGQPQIPKFSATADSESAIPVALVSQSSLAGPDSEPKCRICLGTFEETDEEIIQAPCLCRGSTGRIHRSCLGQWLSMKYGLADLKDDGRYLSYKPPCCEVCKTEFPHVISVGPGAEQIPLLQGLPNVSPPFIVLSIPRSIGEDKARPFGERICYAPAQSADALSLGRSKDCHLRLDDVTVSRVHATITFVDGAFVVKDNDTRFSTLIKPTEAELLPNSSSEPLEVQMGRTVLALSLLEDVEL